MDVSEQIIQKKQEITKQVLEDINVDETLKQRLMTAFLDLVSVSVDYSFDQGMDFAVTHYQELTNGTKSV